MMNDENCDAKSNNLNGCNKENEDHNNVVSSILYNVEALTFNIGEEDDFKALGRIKLEDLEIQESVLELEGEFHKFIVEQTGGYSEVVQVHEYDHDIPTSKIENFEIEESLLQKILDFFSKLYQESEDCVDINYELDPLIRKKKKKRFILESIIEFLKKFLRNGRSLDLKELLDAQILELQEDLINELDPKLRELLQQRLMLLTELRAQMMQFGIGSNLLFRFFLIVSFISSFIGLQQDIFTAQQNVRSLKVEGLFVEKKDEKAFYDGAINSQMLVIADPTGVFVRSYIPGVFYGKINEISYKFHDQYLFIRDISSQLGYRYQDGGFFAVAAIIHTIDIVLQKVVNLVKQAVNKLNVFERSREPFDVSNCIKQSVNVVTHVHTRHMNFTQDVVINSQHITGRLSSMNYHHDFKFACSEIQSNSYLNDINVKQCSVQNTVMSRNC
ncbi:MULTISPECIES: hypothetical protein [Ehrlichia]|uniref:Uncharacterized protein n=1 Tax=Ehrlichia cf. muris str. EmCRT TaxID=1359167 RepID=A0A0F3NBD2_9RICK|nr:MULTISPECIES: hypothetical protein [Ehrlichia]KJV65398.1 hypothetical protein EMUCRT_0339 [Ehrlichia cf. muris str. EmCRT]OUC04653.1 hypothetical protein DB91_00375 [Ehrlichia sp. Wisconsin_h]